MAEKIVGAGSVRIFCTMCCLQSLCYIPHGQRSNRMRTRKTGLLVLNCFFRQCMARYIQYTQYRLTTLYGICCVLLCVADVTELAQELLLLLHLQQEAGLYHYV